MEALVDRQPQAVAPPKPPELYVSPTVKAHNLLMESLDPTQRRTYESRGWFEVAIPHRLSAFSNRPLTKTVYRIGICRRCGQAQVKDYCVHVIVWNEAMPLEDHLLTLKTWIECDTAGFRTTANVYKTPACLN